MNDLMEDGEDTTMARRLRAVFSFDRSWGVTLLYLSNVKVNTGLRIAALKRSRSTPAEKSSKAGGTTSSMRVLELASNIASNGPTTVVLPAPMIICRLQQSREVDLQWRSGTESQWVQTGCHESAARKEISRKEVGCIH